MKTNETARGLRQSAYQVQVASSPGLLGAGKIDLWDSGKVESDETIAIVYAGVKSASRDRCHCRAGVGNRTAAFRRPAIPVDSMNPTPVSL